MLRFCSPCLNPRTRSHAGATVRPSERSSAIQTPPMPPPPRIRLEAVVADDLVQVHASAGDSRALRFPAAADDSVPAVACLRLAAHVTPARERGGGLPVPIQHLAGSDDARAVPYRDIANHEIVASRGLFVAEGRLVVRRLIEDGRC